MSIFGLFIIMSASAFWWNASEDYDEFLESNANYIFDTYQGSDAYVNFAKKVNEGIAIYNSVGGNKEHFTEQQKNDFDEIMLEAIRLQKYTDEWANKYPAKKVTLTSRKDKYDTAKWLSICGITLGAIISFIGFYLWHTRLQKYIDETYKQDNA